MGSHLIKWEYVILSLELMAEDVIYVEQPKRPPLQPGALEKFARKRVDGNEDVCPTRNQSINQRRVVVAQNGAPLPFGTCALRLVELAAYILPRRAIYQKS